jgi:hypothetical protein
VQGQFYIEFQPFGIKDLIISVGFPSIILSALFEIFPTSQSLNRASSLLPCHPQSAQPSGGIPGGNMHPATM